ncbi:MAG: DUF4982 domain-containing protein [Lachnospiraceae bacterium]|nr:DUF4982 domain-containing protein [Lachnospiraceae bacterium]
MFRQSFNKGWSFYKAGKEDRRAVTLPHDAMLEEKRTADAPGGSAGAYFHGDVYTYEKEFEAPKEWESQHILFQFEGVYRNAKVFLNDKEAGGAAYGYIPFFVCADGLLQYGGKNTIRVVADASRQPDSRWYSGGGIYRPVWLWTGEKESIEPEGIRISTLSYNPARILVEVRHNGGDVGVEILDKDGKTAASGTGGKQKMEIPNAALWSDEMPNLYTCRVRLSKDGTVTDTAETTFGIRKVEWSSKGLRINGKDTLLRGGCIHHDNGILGAAAYAESEERRVRILKESGFNALRISHNPASAALLEACDRYGMYVMDETWDMWFHHKNKYDYASDWRENYQYDLKALVARDFNHPSVLMYSIGNEVSEPAKEEGLAVIQEMVEYLHAEDPNRAVTGGFNLMIIASAKKGGGIYNEEGGRKNDNDKAMSGMNSTVFNMVTNMVGTGMNRSANSRKADMATAPALDLLDIAGYNYASGRYPLEAKAHPQRVIIGSETFPQDIAKNWKMVKEYPYLIGDFMWTAWDYLGEAGLGAWAYTPDGKGFNKPYPWLLADCGALDILGNPNGELYLAQAAWGMLDSQPAIAVQPVNHPGIKPAKMVWRGTNALPGWSYRGCDGNKAVVEVYSGQPVVELFLNGKSLGKKKVKDCKAIYKTRYQTGELRAAAYDASGRMQGESKLVSAAGPLQIQAIADKKTVKPGELLYLDIRLTDADGIVEANADTTLTVEAKGGELLGFGSANPRTEERFESGKYTTYYGRAQAVVRAGKAGTVAISVRGDGVKAAAAEIICEG